jgi:hypothetical protein
MVFPAWLLLAATSPLPAGAARIIDDFERPEVGVLWEEKAFKGRTDYAIVREEDGNRVLRAESRNAASGLIRRIGYDLRDYPVLSWRWKIEGVVKKGDERRKEGDDYAARIYVIFPHWFPARTRTLNYIWANRLPRGSHLPNAYYGNAMMIAVESGGENAGRWIAERRDVLADYRRVFGEEPPDVGAIAIMTDTDNTGESARAWYDDLAIAAGPLE